MEHTGALMMFIGAFTFLGFGLASANSIEAHESETTKKIFAAISFAGAVSLIIGFILLLISL